MIKLKPLIEGFLSNAQRYKKSADLTYAYRLHDHVKELQVGIDWYGPSAERNEKKVEGVLRAVISLSLAIPDLVELSHKKKVISRMEASDYLSKGKEVKDDLLNIQRRLEPGRYRQAFTESDNYLYDLHSILDQLSDRWWDADRKSKEKKKKKVA